MANENAKEIVKAAEDMGLTHEKMAEICGVSLTTIYRWKKKGRARSTPISYLENYIGIDSKQGSATKPHPKRRKYLDEASLEELAGRALELGFKTTFTNV